MDSLSEERIKNILDSADVGYSYNLAKELENIRSNPVLGYRSAGSKAEHEAGELIFKRMVEAGFSNVHKDRVDVDAWEFKRAVIKASVGGEERELQLGAYQTNFVTDGYESVQIVDAGKGTLEDYEELERLGINVEGKLVMAEINQREEWWINFPVYQAKLKGAKGFIAVQAGGYGEVAENALNAQDIAGPSDAPAFSISRADADFIKKCMAQSVDVKNAENSDDRKESNKKCDEDKQYVQCKNAEYNVCNGRECTVLFDAYTRVMPNASSYNIVGEIPGENPERMILLSGHYDSYFSGFQDDNTAVSMLIEIGRMLIKGNYKPHNTIILCAMAAEEWGVINSKYDWSTGAYEEVFTVHPEWKGKVIADLNFELPAFAHGNKDYVRSTYEYRNFFRRILKEFPGDLHEAYPDGVGTKAPIQTWSDDFSVAISGIPSTVNEFAGGKFMESHYHSQYDSDEFYDEKVYLFHHKLYAYILLRLDNLHVVPVDFTIVSDELLHRFDREICEDREIEDEFIQAVTDLKAEAQRVNAVVEGRNYSQDVLAHGDDMYSKDDMCSDSVNNGDKSDINNGYDAKIAPNNECSMIRDEDDVRIETELLKAFALAQDTLVTLNWQDDVLFPYETAMNDVVFLGKAIDALSSEKDADRPRVRIKNALNWIYRIDNNQYAFKFEKAVYEYFTGYVLNQPRERLKWGYGRIIHHENLYDVVRSLIDKLNTDDANVDVSDELSVLKEARMRQQNYLELDIRNTTQYVKEITQVIHNCLY